MILKSELLRRIAELDLIVEELNDRLEKLENKSKRKAKK